MQKHPNVPFSTSKWVHVFNGLSILCISGTLIFAIAAYQTLPDKIPIYFNAQGEADGWGHKAMIFLMPLFAVILFIPLYFLSKKPRLFNYPIEITKENAGRIYPLAQLLMAIINFECVLIFTYLTIDIIGQYFSAWILAILFGTPILTVLLFIFIFIRLKAK